VNTQGKARFPHKPGPTQTFTCSEKYSYGLSSDKNFSDELKEINSYSDRWVVARNEDDVMS